MNLLQTVKRIVADQFDKQVDEIGEEFGRAIPDQDAQQLDTVNDIVTYCRDALKIEEPSQPTPTSPCGNGRLTKPSAR